jgi:hypothetical protein
MASRSRTVPQARDEGDSRSREFPAAHVLAIGRLLSRSRRRDDQTREEPKVGTNIVSSHRQGRSGQQSGLARPPRGPIPVICPVVDYSAAFGYDRPGHGPIHHRRHEVQCQMRARAPLESRTKTIRTRHRENRHPPRQHESARSPTWMTGNRCCARRLCCPPDAGRVLLASQYAASCVPLTWCRGG